MKTLIITKNILKHFIKLSVISLIAYISIICFTRAAYMTALTAEDFAIFALGFFGIITLCTVQYILNFLYLTLKRMYSPHGYSNQTARAYASVKKSNSANKPVYTFKNTEAA